MVLYLVFTVLSLVGIGMVIPVLDIILGGTESQIMARPAELHDVDSLQAWLAYWVTQGVTAYGAMGMLWRVCVATLSLFIFKNLTRYAALWNMARYVPASRRNSDAESMMPICVCHLFSWVKSAEAISCRELLRM